MKKAVRILGMVIGLGMILGSCSNDDNGGNDSDPIVVEKSNLIGKYKVVGAIVATPVDYNKDEVANNNLFKEGYNSCIYDNITQITETNFNYIMEGTTCDVSEQNQTNTYVISEDKKTIVIYKNGIELEKLNNIELDSDSEGKAQLYFNKFDEKLNQNVFFTLEKI